MLRDVEERNEHLRRKILERVAVRQHETADPARIVGEQQLAECTAGVVADERDVGESQRVEDLVDHPRHPDRRQIGLRVHRRAMAAERPVDEDGPDAMVGELRGDGIPQCAVDEEPVDEDHRRTFGIGGSERPVVERSAGDGHRRHVGSR